MFPAKANWKIGEADPASAGRLAAELSIDPLLARLLVARGLVVPEQAEAFLRDDPACFHDPYLLDGMDRAVRRIRSAIADKEKIRIYGDYDADGVSSTSLMVHLMRMLGAAFDYYIPHRVHEGYGMNGSAIDHAKKHGVSLIVTVDTGISASEEVAYASSLGIDTIVTDHHEPPERLPDAYAVINPKKPSCTYPFDALAGVGVAFKLAHALLGRLPEELAEIAAIGTVADLMPLVGENRQLVRLGLRRMQNSALPGIRALLGVASAPGREVTASTVAFGIAPRINASGRLDHAGDAVKLLTTESEQEAEHTAFELDRLNRERQRIVEDVAREAFETIERERMLERRVLVLAREDWNVGVIGIVASKLLERYYRPAIVLSIDPQTGIAKGSARSIPGYDIHRALTETAGLLDHFGGHQAAAGMSLHRDRLPEFAAGLNRLAEEWLTEDDLVPVLNADLACRLQEVPLSAIERLDALAPFGMANPAPRFVFTGLAVQEIRTLGREQQHLKLQLAEPGADGGESGGRSAAAGMEALAFGRGELARYLSPTALVDVYGEVSVNEWNGMRRPQIVIQDICVPQVQVFDGRGAANAAERMEQWTAWMSAAEHVRRRGFVPLAIGFGGPSSQPWERDAGWAGVPVRRIGAGDAAAPLSGANAPPPLGEVTDLFVMTLPERLSHLRETLRQAVRLERVYLLYGEAGRGRSPRGLRMPSREWFKAAYQTLKLDGTWRMSGPAQLERLSRRTGVSAGSIQFIMDVFEELSFVERDGAVYRIAASPAKRELSESPLYRGQAERAETEDRLLYATSRQVTDWILAQLV